MKEYYKNAVKAAYVKQIKIINYIMYERSAHLKFSTPSHDTDFLELPVDPKIRNYLEKVLERVTGRL
jgi:hypothetical protein